MSFHFAALSLAERAWRARRLPQGLMIGIAAGALISIAAALTAVLRWHADGQSVQNQVEASSAPVRGVTLAEQGDFVTSLPSIDLHKPFLLEVDRAAQAANVAFVSSTITPASVATGQLRRTEITVRLRGGYPALKQVFKEVLERFPHATVSRVRMNTSSPGAGGAPDAVAPGAAAEAVWVVSLWSVPLSSTVPAVQGPASR